MTIGTYYQGNITLQNDYDEWIDIVSYLKVGLN